jgi:hypothetical protein
MKDDLINNSTNSKMEKSPGYNNSLNAFDLNNSKSPCLDNYLIPNRGEQSEIKSNITDDNNKSLINKFNLEQALEKLNFSERGIQEGCYDKQQKDEEKINLNEDDGTERNDENNEGNEYYSEYEEEGSENENDENYQINKTVDASDGNKLKFSLFN